MNEQELKTLLAQQKVLMKELNAAFDRIIDDPGWDAERELERLSHAQIAIFEEVRVALARLQRQSHE